jgi:RNA polymerase-binding transcription factor DksA
MTQRSPFRYINTSPEVIRVGRRALNVDHATTRRMQHGWRMDPGRRGQRTDPSLLEDELKRMQAMRRPVGASRTHCAECEEPIPEARQSAIPGVRLCLDYQKERAARTVPRGGINRRGSKDSQLK